jgi:RimJ/RimL family protein N-acetyltransferase
LRTWVDADEPALAAAVTASLDHLLPWMWWAASEPMSPADRLEVFAGFRRDWEAGGDAVYGAFLDGEVVGGTGLHRRRGPHVLEIGYWIHVDHLRQGYATEIARSLTDTALTVPGIEVVEIHHDRANVRSRAVPERLGFGFIGETRDEPHAPAEEGVDWCWRTTLGTWTRPVAIDS